MDGGSVDDGGLQKRRVETQQSVVRSRCAFGEHGYTVAIVQCVGNHAIGPAGGGLSGAFDVEGPARGT